MISEYHKYIYTPPMPHTLPADGILIYCASSSTVPQEYLTLARDTGRLIAEAGHPLVSGGGAAGLMASAIDGCIDAGGTAIGVLPQFMIEKAWAHPRLSHTIATPSMHVRKQTMADLSIGAIALPGGIGTLDELCEIMTWHQLGLYRHPVVILNTGGFYDPLLEMFSKMQSLNFMRGGTIPAIVASTPEEAIKLIIS